MSRYDLKSNKVAFIGAGHMAEALVNGLVKSSVCPANHITVADVRTERTSYFRSAFAVSSADNNQEAVRQADIVVLAVKPQVMNEVLDDIKDALPANALVISIAAGVPAKKIEYRLSGTCRVIRVMPNTPALVGRGVSAICSGSRADEEDLAVAEVLLAAVGLVVRVEERDMDAITAVSGSGPAYVFYLVEAMLAAAARLGLDAQASRSLVYGTLEGAARLLAESEVDAAELRRRVTSKGGTTEAAVALLDSRHVSENLVEAILTAAQRSAELSAGE